MLLTELTIGLISIWYQGTIIYKWGYYPENYPQIYVKQKNIFSILPQFKVLSPAWIFKSMDRCRIFHNTMFFFLIPRALESTYFHPFINDSLDLTITETKKEKKSPVWNAFIYFTNAGLHHLTLIRASTRFANVSFGTESGRTILYSCTGPETYTEQNSQKQLQDKRRRRNFYETTFRKNSLLDFSVPVIIGIFWGVML